MSGRLSLTALVLLWTHDTAAAEDLRACIRAHDEAQVLRDDNRWLRARERFLACAQERCPIALQRECDDALRRLEPAIPTIVLRLHDEHGGDVTRAEVAIDGELVTLPRPGMPIELDPGEHVVAVRTPGRPQVERRLVAYASEKNRLWDVVIDAKEPRAESKTGAAPSTEGSHAARTEGQRVPWAVFSGAIAAVGLGGFAYFGLGGNSDLRALRAQSCASTATCARADVDAVETKYLVANLSLGVAIVALGFTTYLVFRELTTPRVAK